MLGVYKYVVIRVANPWSTQHSRAKILLLNVHCFVHLKMLFHWAFKKIEVFCLKNPAVHFWLNLLISSHNLWQITHSA